MRRSFRYAEADSDPGYLVAVSDLMSGLVFLFILTMMVFALSYKEKEEEKESELRVLRTGDETREQILREVKERLEQHGVQVTIDPKAGVLRLPEQILFETGKSDFGPEGKENVAHLAEALSAVLPCYTRVESKGLEPCPRNPDGAEIETVFVEGHADQQRFKRPGRCFIRGDCNWDLSAQRAMRTFAELVEQRPDLTQLVDRDGRPILGVSGYGSTRPIVESESGDTPENRRIDLRFIMARPQLGEPRPQREVRERLE